MKPEKRKISCDIFGGRNSSSDTLWYDVIGRCPRLEFKWVLVSVLCYDMLGIWHYRWFGILDTSGICTPCFCFVVSCTMHQISLPAWLRIVTIVIRGVRSGWTPSAWLETLNCEALCPNLPKSSLCRKGRVRTRLSRLIRHCARKHSELRATARQWELPSVPVSVCT